MFSSCIGDNKKKSKLTFIKFPENELRQMCKQDIPEARGKIFHAIYNGEAVAIKRFAIREFDCDDASGRFRRESNIFKKINNDVKNIVGYVGWGKYKTKRITYCFTVMPFLENGDLYSYIWKHKDRFSWHKKLSMMKGLTRAVSYLHDNHLVHDDLKSLNVLLTPYCNIRLADFETTAKVGTREQSGCTYFWRAPELFKANHKPSYAGDVYSIAVIFCELVNWQRPLKKLGFSQFDDAEKVMAEAKNGRNEVISKKCLPKLAQLFTRCWQEDPKARPTISQVADELREVELPRPSFYSSNR